MTDARRRAAGRAFGDERVRRDAPLAPFTTFKVGGPADWLVDAWTGPSELQRARRRSRAARERAGHRARRRLERADRGRRDPRAGDPRARRRGPRRSGQRRVRADAGVTINGLVRWTIAHGARRPRSVGRHAGDGRRRDLRQRAFQGPQHRRARRGGPLAGPRRAASTTCRPPTWSSATTTAGCSGPARSCCPPISASTAGDPRALRAVARESLAFRKRTQPLAIAERRLHLPESGSGRDRVPDGMPWSAGALVDRAGLKGAREGAARVSPDARQLHRQRRRGDGRRHSATDRAVHRRRDREVRRRAARRDCVLGFEAA